MLRAFLDHHTHTKFSWDSDSLIEDIVGSARKQDLGGVIVTDHLEFHRDDHGFGYYNYDKCLEAFENARELAPDLKIRFGVEVSHHPKHLAEITSFLRGHRFQYILGAVHNIGWEEVQVFMSRSEDEGDNFRESLDPYFVECLKLVESNLYDGLAHLDFPKRYIKTRLSQDFFVRNYERIIRSILTACLDMGVFLEVNTSPYRIGIQEPYPGWSILQLYNKLGGREVILSSDAHRPEDLGTAFGAVIKELSRMGISVRNAA
jgi:histidinol-phosphatase (PHP family)